MIIPQQPIERLALRLPGGADTAHVRVRRSLLGSESLAPAHSFATDAPAQLEGQYAILWKLSAGERIEFLFPLQQYKTVERAAGVDYRVQWKGSSVIGISPAGANVPLYAHRDSIKNDQTPMCRTRYPQ